MLRIGEALFDADRRRLVVGDDERKLSPKAAGVLLALAEAPRQVWSRERLLERAWPGVWVGEEVLTQAIAELRRALRDDARSPRWIETVHKTGYRLRVPVQRDDDDEAPGPRPPSLASYARYLQALDRYERGGLRNTAAAIEAYEAILEDEPGFALAHAGLAKALAFFSIYYAPHRGDLGRALDHCRTARRLAPACAEAYAAEGLILSMAGDPAASLERFGAALMLNPYSSETHYIVGRARLTALDLAAAETMFVQAARLRTDDYHSLLLAAKARQSRSDRGGTRALMAAALPRIDQALAEHPDDLRAMCARARALLHLGRRAEAEALMDDVAAHPDPVNYHLACTYAAAGAPGRALDVLEEVVELGWRHRSWLDSDPDLDPLRGDRRFARLEAALA